MPPGGGQTTARSRRAARRTRRRTPTPPAPRPSPQNAQAYVSQGRAVAHAAHRQRQVARARRATAQARPLSPQPVRPKPVGPTRAQRATARRSLGFQPQLGNLRPAQRAAAQKAQRARQRVGARPMPHVPIVNMPSRRQAQAAHDAIAGAINRQVTGKTARERQASRNAIIREIQTDPRLADVKRASSHYARALERRNAIAITRGLQPNQEETAASLRTIAGNLPRGVRALNARPVTPTFTGTRREQLRDLRQAASDFGSPLSPRSQAIRAGREVARFARQTNRYKALARPKARHVGIGPAQVNITPAATKLGAAAAAALAQTSLGTGDIGPRNFARAVGRDVGMIATGPFVGGYELGRAGVDVAIGNATGDVAQANRGLERAGRLGRGIAKGTIETFTHPIRSFEQDPLISALTVAGGVGAVGRVGGAVARGLGSTAEGAGLRGALARAGSEVRPPIAYSADAARAGLRERRYSRDIIRKSVQVANDARREPLRHPDGSVVTVRRQGREVPVLAPRGPRRTRDGAAVETGTLDEVERMGRSQADFLAARQQAVEYAMRDRASKEFRVRGIRGQHAKDAVAMVVEGTIRSARTFHADLRAYRDMVKGEIERHGAGEKVFRTSRELRDAKAQVARIDRLLTDKRVHAQIPKIVAAGEDIGRKLNLSEFESRALGMMDPVRAERARLIHPAILHMGAKHFTPEEIEGLRRAGVDVSEEALKHGALRKSNGQFISNRDIEQVFRETGRDPRSVAFLPPGALGRSAFHRRFTLQRPTIGGTRTRTGEQFRRGLTGARAETVREQGVKLAITTQKGRGVDRVISEHGMTHPSGRYFTAKEAEEYAARVLDDTGERLIPVRGVPARADAAMDRLARGQQSPTAMENLAERLFNDRLRVDPNSKNVVLMPASIVDRLQKHAAPAHDIVKLGQWLNRPFRSAVLPQPRWLFGNIAEPAIRLTIKGSGVNVFGLGADLIAATRALRAGKRSGNPAVRQAADEMEAQIGLGLFVGNRGATVRRTLEELPGHQAWGPVIAKLPVMGHMLQVSRLALRGAMAPANAFFRLNRVIENVANRANFGHDVRAEIRSFQGSWTKSVTLGQRAVEEAMQGLVNTSTQRRFAVQAHETLGKYNAFNPTMRALTQTILPFVPWFLNATRFVFWTMPAHHTTTTALLQQAAQTVQKDWEDIHKDTPPGNLRFAIPNGKGGWVDIARYTPWGAFTEATGGGGGGDFMRQILPQLGGVQKALEGQTPFGDPLAPPPGEEPNQVAVALNAAVEALVPYVAQARRLREGGATGYSTSTVLHPETKPGTKHMSGVERTFSPLAPTYLRAPTGAAPAGRTGARAVRRAQRSARRAGGSDAAVQRALRRARRHAAGGGG